MSVLLIASDRPGAGKTATTLALARLAATRSGRKASAVKPFASAPDDPDIETYAKLGHTGPVEGGDSATTSQDSTDLVLHSVGYHLGLRRDLRRAAQLDRSVRRIRRRRIAGSECPARRVISPRPPWGRPERVVDQLGRPPGRSAGKRADPLSGYRGPRQPPPVAGGEPDSVRRPDSRRTG